MLYLFLTLLVTCSLWGPKTLTLLSPNVTEFRIGTVRSSLYLFEFPWNAWQYSSECFGTFPNVWHSPHSPRSPHPVPRPCISGFIHSPNKVVPYEKSRLVENRLNDLEFLQWLPNVLITRPLVPIHKREIYSIKFYTKY